LGLIDDPGPRKIHHHAIPRIGGIAIATGALGSVLVVCFVFLTAGTGVFARSITEPVQIPARYLFVGSVECPSDGRLSDLSV